MGARSISTYHRSLVAYLVRLGLAGLPRPMRALPLSGCGGRHWEVVMTLRKLGDMCLRLEQWRGRTCPVRILWGDDQKVGTLNKAAPTRNGVGSHWTRVWLSYQPHEASENSSIEKAGGGTSQEKPRYAQPRPCQGKMVVQKGMAVRSRWIFSDG